VSLFFYRSFQNRFLSQKILKMFVETLTENKSKIQLRVIEKTMLADTLTPVTLYLRLRDRFPGALLLESSDYHGKENALSFLCLDAMSSITLTNGKLETESVDGKKETKHLNPKDLVFDELDAFFKSFEIDKSASKIAQTLNGFFGFSAYDAVQHFETLDFASIIFQTN